MPLQTVSPTHDTPPGDKRRRNRLLGIGLMALGFFTFAAVDTMAKFMTGHFHPFQIVWTRQLGLVAVVLVMAAVRGPGFLRSRLPGIQILRGAVAAVSATLFIFGVAYVPLADAVSVTFVAPFIVTALGALILGEKVGLRRWVAVSIGFAGTLIVIRPGMGVFHPAIVLPVLAAGFFAVRQIASRTLAAADPTATTIAYTALTSVAVLTIPALLVWETPQTAEDIGLFAAMAVLAAVAEMLIIRSLELAEAVVLAPIHYSMIIWGTFYGWMIFDELPDRWTILGAAIIVGTGLYVINRERARRR